MAVRWPIPALRRNDPRARGTFGPPRADHRQDMRLCQEIGTKGPTNVPRRPWPEKHRRTSIRSMTTTLENAQSADESQSTGPEATAPTCADFHALEERM